MQPASSAWVKDVTEATFEADVIAASDEAPVVVDFWSPRCAPCRTLGPMLEGLTTERQGKVILAKVNTDDNPRLAAYFQIDAIPAVKVIYRRQLVHEFEGLQPEPALREFFNQIVPDDRDPELLQAMAAEESAPDRAEKLYRTMIAKDPERTEPRVGLARVLVRQEKFDEVAEVLEPVGSSGEAGAEAEGLLAQVKMRQGLKGLPDERALRQRLAANPKDATSHLDLGKLLAARGEAEAALAELYAAAELDFKLAQGQAREAMVQVFYAIGTNHPLANEYRSRLARLLY
ncbi:MAG: tetratricopeptide repeat protein [Gemmataceae bacterium]